MGAGPWIHTDWRFIWWLWPPYWWVGRAFGIETGSFCFYNFLFLNFAVRAGRCGIGRRSSDETSSMPTSRSCTLWCRRRRPPRGSWTRRAPSVSRPISCGSTRVSCTGVWRREKWRFFFLAAGQKFDYVTRYSLSDVDLRMKPYNRWNAIAGHTILEVSLPVFAGPDWIFILVKAHFSRFFFRNGVVCVWWVCFSRKRGRERLFGVSRSVWLAHDTCPREREGRKKGLQASSLWRPQLTESIYLYWEREESSRGGFFYDWGGREFSQLEEEGPIFIKKNLAFLGIALLAIETCSRHLFRRKFF